MQALNARSLNLRVSCGDRPATRPVQQYHSRCTPPQQSLSFGSALRQQQPQGITSTSVGFFSLGGQTAQSGGIYGSQGKDEYTADDVEQYFNYMGMLAEEGSYDRLEEVLKSDLHPADILLLWAAKENDTPKAAELLRAGADKDVKDLNGKTPSDLTTDDEIKAMLADLQIAQDFEKDD
jgi:hypothetical protein